QRSYGGPASGDAMKAPVWKDSGPMEPLEQLKLVTWGGVHERARNYPPYAAFVCLRLFVARAIRRWRWRLAQEETGWVRIKLRGVVIALLIVQPLNDQGWVVTEAMVWRLRECDRQNGYGENRGDGANGVHVLLLSVR